MGGTSRFTAQVSLTTRILLLFIGLQFFISCTSAQPVVNLAEPFFSRELLGRADRAVINNETGIPRVFKPGSGEVIAQGPATDGAGSGWNVPAVLWVVFSWLIGVPMALAGIRGWRFTTGTGIGLAVSILSYAGIINTVDETGVSDLVLTFIVFAFFFLGFCLGLLEFARLGGITLVGVTGGLALGIRVVLSKEGMVLSASNLYPVNWVIVGVLGVMGGFVMMWKQRVGLTLGCASIGTFFCALGLDLFMSKQTGISRGLRFLLDRNPSHLVDIIENGYHPTLRTRIIIYASMGLIPILAYAQHKIFRHPFSRLPVPDDRELQIDYPTEETGSLRPLTQGFLASLWEGARMRGQSPNRFSLESFTMRSKHRQNAM